MGTIRGTRGEEKGVCEKGGKGEGEENGIGRQ